MKQDEIIEMGKKVFLCDEEGRDDNSIIITSHLQAFAKLVAAKEREACAKVCDSEKKWWNGMSHAEKDIYQAIDNISACIRARGNV